MELIKWGIAHWAEVLQTLVQIIGLASLIVKLTPTLKDDNVWLPIVKFLGKYIALNKSVSSKDRPLI